MSDIILSGTSSFGHTVAISPDGSKVFVNNMDVEAIHVYYKAGNGTWTPTYGLVISGTSHLGHANVLHVSDDCNKVIAGAHLSKNAAVFEWNGSTWVGYLLTLPGSATASSAYVVSMSRDGNTAAVGDCGSSKSGGSKVYVFTRGPSGWLGPTTIANTAGFSYAIDLSSNGLTGVVATTTNIVYVINYSSTWSQTQVTLPTTVIQNAISMSGDGNRFAVGGSDRKIYIATFSSFWTYIIITPPVFDGYMAEQVKLSIDGDTLYVRGGAGIYKYTFDGSSWSLASLITLENLLLPINNRFGISTDEKTIVFSGTSKAYIRGLVALKDLKGQIDV